MATLIPTYSVNRVAYAPGAQVSGDMTYYITENGGYSWLEIENPGTLAFVVGAVVFGNAVDDITIPDKQVTVDPGSAVKFGPFPKGIYNQEDLSVDFSIEDSYLAYPDAGTCLKFQAFDLG